MVSKDDKKYKVILIGGSNVGKTSIIMRKKYSKFQSNLGSTIGIEYSLEKAVSKKGEEVQLQIWDTAGQERFLSITKSYYRGSHIIIVVFSLVDEESIVDLSKYIGYIEQETDNVPLIFVGNKCDLLEENKEDILVHRAKEFIDSYKIKVNDSLKQKGEKEIEIPYFTTSAKSNVHINELFTSIADILTEDSNKQKESKSMFQWAKKQKQKKCC